MAKPNWMCKHFGHIMPKGWAGGAPYLHIGNIATDGLGTKHAYLMAECERCGESWNVANVHLPKEEHNGKSD